jgi:hypothetical protein
VGAQDKIATRRDSRAKHELRSGLGLEFGRTAHVDDKTIGEVLRRHDDPYAATRELVVAANAGGGTDNVSDIVVYTD